MGHKCLECPVSFRGKRNTGRSHFRGVYEFLQSVDDFRLQNFSASWS